jgi:hypothetical protein
VRAATARLAPAAGARVRDLDLVDIILELEQHFHLTIPDDVPLVRLRDFSAYIVTQLPASSR